jgi:hypothetical protein
VYWKFGSKHGIMQHGTTARPNQPAVRSCIRNQKLTSDWFQLYVAQTVTFLVQFLHTVLYHVVAIAAILVLAV